eukprot:11155007-Lingulodinium_polyedra.AAC.1
MPAAEAARFSTKSHRRWLIAIDNYLSPSDAEQASVGCWAETIASTSSARAATRSMAAHYDAQK